MIRLTQQWGIGEYVRVSVSSHLPTSHYPFPSPSLPSPPLPSPPLPSPPLPSPPLPSPPLPSPPLPLPSLQYHPILVGDIATNGNFNLVCAHQFTDAVRSKVIAHVSCMCVCVCVYVCVCVCVCAPCSLLLLPAKVWGCHKSLSCYYGNML